MLELLKRYGKPYRGKIFLGVFTKVIEVVINLLTPIIVARMVDSGVANRNVDEVIFLGILLVVASFVGYGFTLVCQKMAGLISQGMGTDLRRELFHTIGQLDSAKADQFGAPSLLTRVTSDINQVQVALALAVRQLVRWPLLAIGSMVAAVLIDVRLGAILVACTLLVGGVFWAVMARSVPYFRQVQGELDSLSLVTREALSGVRVIRAFGREDAEDARFEAAARSQARLSVAVGTLSAILNPATLLIMNLGIVAILWSAGLQVDAGEVTQGEVLAFVNYMMQTLQAIVYLANLVIVFTRGSACATRITEVLDTPSSLVDKPGATAPESSFSAPVLELDHVSFTYEGAPVSALNDVTLTLLQGGTLGVIGGTGSGKSTLARLACRLYDATEGSVNVLGQDIRDWPGPALHHQVSLVPQSASLVSGTIRSNLCWRDPNASDEELWRALQLAQAADFVSEKPQGLDSPVEAGGRNFSGGQRQRLTIARALVGSPRLVVLDDSASALDFATDARLRQALRELAPDTASIVISQRVSAVMHADLVLVLDHGEVAGLGSHRELLADCPLYREICLTQLRPGEVYA